MKQMSDSFDSMYAQYMQQEQMAAERAVKEALEIALWAANEAAEVARAGAAAGAEAAGAEAGEEAQAIAREQVINEGIMAPAPAYGMSASSQMDQISHDSYNLYNLPAGMPAQDLPVETFDDDNSQNE